MAGTGPRHNQWTDSASPSPKTPLDMAGPADHTTRPAKRRQNDESNHMETPQEMAVQANVVSWEDPKPQEQRATRKDTLDKCGVLEAQGYIKGMHEEPEAAPNSPLPATSTSLEKNLTGLPTKLKTQIFEWLSGSDVSNLRRASKIWAAAGKSRVLKNDTFVVAPYQYDLDRFAAFACNPSFVEVVRHIKVYTGEVSLGKWKGLTLRRCDDDDRSEAVAQEIFGMARKMNIRDESSLFETSSHYRVAHGLAKTFSKLKNVSTVTLLPLTDVSIPTSNKMLRDTWPARWLDDLDLDALVNRQYAILYAVTSFPRKIETLSIEQFMLESPPVALEQEIYSHLAQVMGSVKYLKLGFQRGRPFLVDGPNDAKLATKLVEALGSANGLLKLDLCCEVLTESWLGERVSMEFAARWKNIYNCFWPDLKEVHLCHNFYQHATVAEKLPFLYRHKETLKSLYLVDLPRDLGCGLSHRQLLTCLRDNLRLGDFRVLLKGYYYDLIFRPKSTLDLEGASVDGVSVDDEKRQYRKLLAFVKGEADWPMTTDNPIRNKNSDCKWIESHS